MSKILQPKISMSWKRCETDYHIRRISQIRHRQKCTIDNATKTNSNIKYEAFCFARESCLTHKHGNVYSTQDHSPLQEITKAYNPSYTLHTTPGQSFGKYTAARMSQDSEPVLTRRIVVGSMAAEVVAWEVYNYEQVTRKMACTCTVPSIVRWDPFHWPFFHHNSNSVKNSRRCNPCPWWSDRHKFLHMARQHSCRAMCKICGDQFIMLWMKKMD